MFKVKVAPLTDSNFESPSNLGTFDTEVEALAWIERIEAKDRPWGHKKARWLSAEQVALEGLSLDNAEDTRVVEDAFGEDKVEYYYPQTYHYIIEDVTAEYEANQRVQERIIEGNKIKKLCENVLLYVAGLNSPNMRSLTAEQVTIMETNFAAPIAYLNSARPWSAYPLIAAIEPDGELVTEEIKQDILDLFANSGLSF